MRHRQRQETRSRSGRPSAPSAPASAAPARPAGRCRRRCSRRRAAPAVISNASPALVGPLITASPGRMAHRHRLAGQRRFVEGRRTLRRPSRRPAPRRRRGSAAGRRAAIASSGTSSSSPSRWRMRRPRHPREQGGHLPPRPPLGEGLEVLAARIHQRDHRGRQRLAEGERRRHRQRRDDVEADVAARAGWWRSRRRAPPAPAASPRSRSSPRARAAPPPAPPAPAARPDGRQGDEERAQSTLQARRASWRPHCDHAPRPTAVTASAAPGLSLAATRR